MRIVITDSGVGGLSVCAYAERYVRLKGLAEPVRLTFANAAPANDYGYNAMPSRDEKLETFDRFLRSVNARFSPDLIYVACNTLSVLLPDTLFFRDRVAAVKGIVDTSVELLMKELSARPERLAMIFGTQTTIDVGTYRRRLAEYGIHDSRVVDQACPGLADVISEDREGSRTRTEISKWVEAAIEKMPRRDLPVVACLACTHYGYRIDMFSAALREAGIDAKVVNPNELAVDDFLGPLSNGPHADAEVQFITRYAIPDTTIETLTWFLTPISPKTVEAMRNFEHVPDLF